MAVLGLLSLAETLKAPGGIPWEWLIVKVFDFVANYGWRIVLFTVLLKFVLLPLDLYQKHCMRKNQRITERLKPEMEKLQKAYGHDKQMFAQKQMELNKREGFSYFSSCLPMILTLVIFIWLWNSMRLISEFMIFRQYVEWDDRYQLVQGYLEDDDHFYRAADNNNHVYITADGQILALNDEGDYQTVNDKGGFVKPEDGGVKYVKNESGSYADSDGNVLNTEGMELYCWASEAEQSRVQSIVAAAIENYNATLEEGQTPLPGTDVRPGMAAESDWTSVATSDAVNQVCQQAVADFYAGEETNRQDFLWIASVWRPDVPWEKPIGSHSAFINSIGRYAEDAGRSGITAEELSRLIASDNYNRITGRLAAQEDRANGYLVLPILSIGLSFLSYFISQRQQKKAGQAPVEGAAGAGTMKFMMILMPLMMGFFALTYSAAFTLYMVVNSSTTIVINLLSSFILDTKDKLAEKKAVSTVQKYGRPDPNAGAGGDKKQKGTKNADGGVQKYGRPDPNAAGPEEKDKADKPSKLPKKFKRR